VNAEYEIYFTFFEPRFLWWNNGDTSSGEIRNLRRFLWHLVCTKWHMAIAFSLRLSVCPVSSALASSVLLVVLGRWKIVGVSGTCKNWLVNSRFSDTTIWREGKSWKLRYVFLANGWSDLNETWYIEIYNISNTPVLTWIGSGDIGGGVGKRKSWRLEILGNA